MKVTRPMFLVFAAALSTTAYAAETTLPVKALRLKQESVKVQVPVGEPVRSEKKIEPQKAKPATLPAEQGYTIFDQMNEAVNDPVIIKGKQEMLKQSIKEDAARQPVLRDAPNSNAPALKKPRVKKHLPADPVKGNNLI